MTPTVIEEGSLEGSAQGRMRESSSHSRVSGGNWSGAIAVARQVASAPMGDVSPFRVSWEQEIATQTAGQMLLSGSSFSDALHSADLPEQSGDTSLTKEDGDLGATLKSGQSSLQSPSSPLRRPKAVSESSSSGSGQTGEGRMEIVSRQDDSKSEKVVGTPAPFRQHIGNVSTSGLQREPQSSRFHSEEAPVASSAHSKKLLQSRQTTQISSLPTANFAISHAEALTGRQQSLPLAKDPGNERSESAPGSGSAIEPVHAQHETALAIGTLASVSRLTSAVSWSSSSGNAEAAGSTEATVAGAVATGIGSDSTAVRAVNLAQASEVAQVLEVSKKSGAYFGALAGGAEAQTNPERIGPERSTNAGQDAASGAASTAAPLTLVHSFSTDPAYSSQVGPSLPVVARSSLSSEAAQSASVLSNSARLGSVAAAKGTVALPSSSQPDGTSRSSSTQSSPSSGEQLLVAKSPATSSSLSSASVRLGSALSAGIADRIDSGTPESSTSVREFAPDSGAREVQTAPVAIGSSAEKMESAEAGDSSSWPAELAQSSAQATAFTSQLSTAPGGEELTQQFQIAASFGLNKSEPDMSRLDVAGSKSPAPARSPEIVPYEVALSGSRAEANSGESAPSSALERSGLNGTTVKSATSAGDAHAGASGSSSAAVLSTSGFANPAVSGEVFRTGPSNSSQHPVDFHTNPFPAMDSQAAVPVSSYRGSTAGELQVGYQDPVLGYVELRAHGDGSGVHASLGAQSASAGEALEGHLSSLAGWLNERHTPVESLTVFAAEGSRSATTNSNLDSNPDSRTFHSGSADQSNGMANGAGQDADREGRGDDRNTGRTTGQVDSLVGDAISGNDSVTPSAQAFHGFAGPSSSREMPGGSSISVMA
jgi:hypothetical protein